MSHHEPHDSPGMKVEVTPPSNEIEVPDGYEFDDDDEIIELRRMKADTEARDTKLKELQQLDVDAAALKKLMSGMPTHLIEGASRECEAKAQRLRGELQEEVAKSEKVDQALIVTQVPPAVRPKWREMEAAITVKDAEIAHLQQQKMALEAHVAATAQTEARQVSEDIKREVRRMPTMPLMSQKRANHACIAITGHVFVIGGEDTRSAERFGLTSHSWSQMANMPATRRRHACAVAGGSIFAVGGNVSGSTSTSVIAYNVDRNEWSAKSLMSSPRQWHSCAVVNDTVYAFGGSTSSNHSEYVAPVEQYDVSRDTWSTAGTPVVTGCARPCPFAGGAVTINNSIYIVGSGWNDGATFRWDPRVPGLTFDTLTRMPSHKYHYGCAAVGDCIYIVSGRNNDTIYDTVSIYDTRADRWREGARLPQALWGLSCAAADEVIYAVGGALDALGRDITDTTHRYHALTDMWY